MSAAGCFDPRGDEFKISDVLSLNCGSLVQIKSIAGRAISLMDDDGEMRTVDVSEIYRTQDVWPWGGAQTPAQDELKRNQVGGHYVYFVTYMDKIVYIGKGAGDRYKHPTSGRSSCYYLNELHFRGEVVDVRLFKTNLSARAAAVLEAEQINLHKPTFNTVIPKASLLH